MRPPSFPIFILACLLAFAASPASAQDVEVDVELVLAVDVSLSMDIDEQEVQRGGYVAAFRDAQVIEAIRSGPNGRIAVAYLEWAGANDQHLVVDWTLVDGPGAGETFAAALAEQPQSRMRRTSISAALERATSMFDDNGFSGLRQVIDVSGDGANNQGPLVEESRDRAVAAGITVNGLPVMLKRAMSYSMFDISQLDLFYEDCVIGGPGAFMIPVREVARFPEAIRAKLILEIAGLAPAREEDLVARVQMEERPPCDIGEQQWRSRMLDGYR